MDSRTLALEGTASAAFASDHGGRIVGWNSAAEESLGYTAQEVLGRPCHGIIRGRDVFGNLFCTEHCNLREMVACRIPIRSFSMDVRNSAGNSTRLDVSIVVVPGARSTAFTIVHLLRRHDDRPTAGSLWGREGNPVDVAIETPCATTGRFAMEGEYWTIAFRGSVVRMKDAKGLHDIRLLMRHPGREFHVFDLVAETEGLPIAAPAGPGSTTRLALTGDALSVGPLPEGEDPPDRRATATYRRRLADLQADLQAAERFNDPVRASQARTEMEFLQRELAAIYGIGGRRRRFGPGERARKAVGKRIRAEIRKLAGLHPVLGRHLSDAIRTGIFCSYDPPEPVEWVFD
jgi:hypothetical protein